MMQAASAVEYPGRNNSNPLGTPELEEGLDLVQLRKQFTDYATVKMEEIDENRQSNRYYHGEQLTETQRKVLKARGQPEVIFNRSARKVNGIVGVVMADFRISYLNEADLLAYARSIGFANGDLQTQGPLPDGVGSWFLTGPFAIYTGADGKLSERAWITPPDRNGLGGVPAAPAGYGRTLRINGNNPFMPEGSLPLPDATKVVIWPPNDPANPGYVQPEFAVVA